MADSLLSQLMALIGNEAGNVGRGAGVAADEIGNLLQGASAEATDPYGSEASQPNDINGMIRKYRNVAGAPLRAIDRAAEFYTGSPAIISRDKPLNSPMMMGVNPGVSKDEAQSATTKYEQLHAANLKKQSDMHDMAMSLLMDRLKADSESSKFKANAMKPDSANGRKISKEAPLMFTAIGDDVRRGDGSKLEKPSSGSFSKTPTQNEQTRAVAKLMKSGVPQDMAEMIFKLQSSKSAQELEANKAAASLMPKGRGTPQQEDELVLMEAMKQKDPMAALAVARKILRLKGRRDDYLDELFGKIK